MSSVVIPGFATVQRSVEIAIGLLYKNDYFLITNCTHERSITHKFAEYIQKQFPEWHVDCEYNRLGLDMPKRLTSQNTSYPDIIIHLRNTKSNILVIQAKSVNSSDHDDKDDKRKIQAYIEDADYQYRFGLWICFSNNIEKTKLDWFENRSSVCCEVI